MGTVGLVAKKKLPPTGLPLAKRLATKSLSSIAKKSVGGILKVPCGIIVENPHQGGPCGIVLFYPSISPYAYCNWNPLKYVDPDGMNSQLTINGNTITISAKYYSLPKDYNSVQRATAFWNNQKDLKYTAPDGKVYSVRFELKAYQSNNPKNEILSGTISKNTYGVVRSLGKDANGNLRTGVTINNQHIKVIEARESGTTGAHEVGHSLMDTHNQDYEHTESGIMTPHVNDNNRSKRVTQETVNTIVESNGFNSKNQSLWSRIKSFFE